MKERDYRHRNWGIIAEQLNICYHYAKSIRNPTRLHARHLADCITHALRQLLWYEVHGD